MKTTVLFAAATAAALFGVPRPAAAFEKIALVDGNDFATVLDGENPAGIARILDRVLKTGADTVLWRTHSGAIPRYPSREEDGARLAHPLDIRRLPNISKVHSWVRYWENEPDRLATVAADCARRPQVRTFGVHMLVEEAHYQFQYLGAWNLEHPQYWCRSYDGTVEMHHSSFAYPEVRTHRLAIVREILERQPAMLYLDTTRNGRYGPRCDYVQPNLDEWARRYPGEPVPTDFHDHRWCEVVARNHYAYYRGIREEIRRTGRRIPFVLTIANVREDGRDWNFEGAGFDWRKVVDDGLVDGISVASMSADPKEPFASTERIFRQVMAYVNGRCKVYFPIRAYNFSRAAPSYVQLAEWAGVSTQEAIRRLLDIAVRCGAAGIVMECVDPEEFTYPEADAAVIRAFAP